MFMPLIYDAADVVVDNLLKVIARDPRIWLSVFANIVQHFICYSLKMLLYTVNWNQMVIFLLMAQLIK